LTYSGTESGTPVFTYVAPIGVNQSATFNTAIPGAITVNIAGPPVAPAALTLTPGAGQIGLSWTASPTATSYLIRRGTASGSETVTVDGTDAAATFTDTGLTNGVTYYYIVTASNAYGAGGVSSEASATPAQTFGQWIAAAFPGISDTNVIGMAAQPERDGMSNLLKYFMGLNPAAPGGAPVTCGPDGQGNMVLYFRMSKNLTAVSYSVDQSTDLKVWSSTGLQGTVTADMGSYYNMKVSIPMTGSKDVFLRLSVSSP
jgi:hypothetical protein